MAYVSLGMTEAITEMRLESFWNINRSIIVGNIPVSKRWHQCYAINVLEGIAYRLTDRLTVFCSVLIFALGVLDQLRNQLVFLHPKYDIKFLWFFLGEKRGISGFPSTYYDHRSVSRLVTEMGHWAVLSCPVLEWRGFLGLIFAGLVRASLFLSWAGVVWAGFYNPLKSKM